MCVISTRAGTHLCVFSRSCEDAGFVLESQQKLINPVETQCSLLAGQRVSKKGSLKHKPLFLHWRALSQNPALTFILTGHDCFLKDSLASIGPQLSNTFLTGHCKYSDLIHSICQKTRSANKQITLFFFFLMNVSFFVIIG